MASFKALELSREMQDELKKRFGSLVVGETMDVDQNPVITVSDGTPVAGEKVMVLKIKPIDWPLPVNIFGTAQTVFSPHVVQIVTESNPAAGAGADILPTADLLAFLGCVLGRRIRTEWYQSANGAVPTVAAIIPANLKGTYDELYWGMLQGQ